MIRYLAFALALVPAMTFAQFIDIKGIVVDDNKVRIPNALVSTADNSLTVKTNFNGEFRIITTGTSSRRINLNQPSTIKISGKGLSIPMNGNTCKTTIVFFDATGKCMSRFNISSDPGSEIMTVPLPNASTASRMIFARVQNNGETRDLALMKQEKTWRILTAAGSSRESVATGNGLAKAPALKLSVSAPGYADTTIALAFESQTAILTVPTSHLKPRVEGIISRINIVGDTIGFTWLNPNMDRAVITGSYKVYVSDSADYAGNPICFKEMPTMYSGEIFMMQRPKKSGDYFISIVPMYQTQRFINSDDGSGPFSAPHHFTLNEPIQLTINRGDLFTVTNQCTLTILDQARQIKSVWFTDTVIYDRSGIAIPIYGIPDPHNPFIQTGLLQDSIHMIPWNLQPGNGVKKVWAKVFLMNDTALDLFDEIRIRPWNINVNLRNATTGPAASMIPQFSTVPASRSMFGITQFNIFRPWIDFSVVTDSDSSFSSEIDFWLAFPDSSFTALRYKEPDTATEFTRLSVSWLETQPVHHTIKRNPATDSVFLRYVFSPDSLSGQTALSNLTRTGLRHSKRSDLTTISKTGRFWGIANVTSSSARDSVATLSLLTPRQAYNRLTSTHLYRNFYPKECAIVIRMRGRFFNDVRTYISSPNINPDSRFQTNICFSPPMILRDAFEFNNPTEGDTLDPVFSINTNTTGITGGTNTSDLIFRGYIKSIGGARVSAVQLIFAKMPAGLASSWIPNKTWSTISYDSIQAWKTLTYDLTIPTPIQSLPGAIFNNINTTSWSNGDYLMAYITQDEFGNRGIAPYQISGMSFATINTNPQRVVIQH